MQRAILPLWGLGWDDIIRRRLLSLVFVLFERRKFKLAKQRHSDADARAKSVGIESAGLVCKSILRLKTAGFHRVDTPLSSLAGIKIPEMFH